MHDAPLTIGIETSGLQGSVAICRGAETIGERVLSRQGFRHAQSLVVEMQKLLKSHSLVPRQIEQVAVSIGPGSFTGLRIGVVAAKTLAYATEASLVAVDTFLAIAENCPAEFATGDVFVIENAQRGDLYFGRYRPDESGCWNVVEDVQLVDGESWCKERQSDEIVMGPGLRQFQAALESRAMLLPDDSCHTPKGATIARLGHQQIDAGDVAILWGLEPRYFRRSAAEENADTKASRS